ncbi:MAG: diguanylate cyclase, partial [bacterium]
RDMLTHLLTSWGHTVITASDGESALTELNSVDGPRIAILDWIMPGGLEGIEVCRKIREKNTAAYTYIILLTSKSGQADYLEGMEAGVDNYLTKPFIPEQLRSILRVGARVISSQEAILAEHEKEKPADERITLAMQSMNDGVWDWNIITGHAYYSPRWCEMLGYASDDIINSINSWELLIHHDDIPVAIATLANHLKNETPAYESEMRLLTKDGTYRWMMYRGVVVERDEKNNPIRLVGTQKDITESKERELSYKHQAMHDSLTDLPNRTYFNDRLSTAIANARINKSLLAVIFVDLDGFKQVNSLYGHQSGDKLLIEVGNRLSNVIRLSDSVARLGGDEFCLLIVDLKSANNAAEVAKKVLHAFKTPVKLDEGEFDVQMSLGISLYPNDHEDASVLMQLADYALYEAKAAGKNTYRFFDEQCIEQSSTAIAQNRIKLLSAIENGEINLLFSPEMNVISGNTDNVTALPVWQQKDGTLVDTQTLMQKAVDASFDIDFDLAVTGAVCREYLKWKVAGYAPNTVGFKISAEMFFSDNAVENLSEIAAKYGISSGELEIQVDENIISRHPHRSQLAFDLLRKSGFKSSIDNFGLGVSAFAQLKTLAVNKYRLDKSITRNVNNDYYHSLLAQVAVDISHQSDKIIVASGIENEAQKKFFIDRNYDILQGECISPSISSEQMAEIIKS